MNLLQHKRQVTADYGVRAMRLTYPIRRHIPTERNVSATAIAPRLNPKARLTIALANPMAHRPMA
ncbi:MAG: hypothetical protein MRJ67_18220, partial [Nitrospirales bacterium]|nr:hypothetical protein [Nitrospirales bacterium]